MRPLAVHLRSPLLPECRGHAAVVGAQDAGQQTVAVGRSPAVAVVVGVGVVDRTAAGRTLLAAPVRILVVALAGHTPLVARRVALGHTLLAAALGRNLVVPLAGRSPAGRIAALLAGRYSLAAGRMLAAATARIAVAVAAGRMPLAAAAARIAVAAVRAAAVVRTAAAARTAAGVELEAAARKPAQVVDQEPAGLPRVADCFGSTWDLSS